MLRDEIYEVYENMGSDEAARKRMLKNIRSAALQKEFVKKEKKRSMKKQSAKMGFRLAAGVINCKRLLNQNKYKRATA